MLEKKRIVVIGTGKMGRLHARVLNRFGNLVGVSDTNADSAKLIGELYCVPFYTNYHDLIKETNPDGVVIAIPTSMHDTVAIDIINNFNLKSILLEKPIAETVEKAEAIKRAAAKHPQTKVAIGHIEVHNPVVVKALNLLKEGSIGNVRSILFQRKGAVDKSRLGSIGDIFEDLGVHDFDVALKILGSGNIDVSCTSITLDGYHNSATITLLRENDTGGTICTFLLSREFAGKVRLLELEGTIGTMSIDLLSQIITIRSLGIAESKKKSIRIPYKSGEAIKVYGEPLQEQMWNFIDCINGRAEPLVGIDDGINALRIATTAREARQSKKILSISIN